MGAITGAKIGGEVKYSPSNLRRIFAKGWGAKVISVGGGYSDAVEFCEDMDRASVVKQLIEGGRLEVVVQNAIRSLEYAVEPALRRQGRKLVIVVTEN